MSCENERDRLLRLLSEVNERINITKAELAEFSNLHNNNDDLISDDGSEIQSDLGGNSYEDIPNGGPSEDGEKSTEDNVSLDDDTSRKKNCRNLDELITIMVCLKVWFF